jgi:hypothetical protein
LIDSVDKSVNQFATYSTNNASASGAYMAVNRLYRDTSWRTGYSNLVLAGDTISVVIRNTSIGANPDTTKGIRIRSTGRNRNVSDLTQVMIFNGRFNEFAVWAKDTVTEVTTRDPYGNLALSLLMSKAPFMPDINQTALVNEATSQGHVRTEAVFDPPDGYPEQSESEETRDFYFDDVTEKPHITHVQGDMHVRSSRTIYGIVIVEGDAVLDGNAKLEGILFLPNPTSTVLTGGGDPKDSSVTGGIITWGRVDGEGNHISVKYYPEYMNVFANGYVPINPPMRVLSWQ